MGVVYLAEHAGLGRQVAIKVLNEEQAREKLGLERFFREARAAAPWIIQILSDCTTSPRRTASTFW